MKFWLFLITLPIITSAKTLKAKAYIFKAVPSLPDSDLEVIGTIDFYVEGSKVSVNGSISGLAPGQHGFHIHQYGDINNKCVAAGPHFNPHKLTHGGPDASVRHVGDLGNIQASTNGVASIDIDDSKIALDGPNSVVGRAVVVHEKPDDLGMGGNEESKKTGNAGARLGCGVIGIIFEDEEPPPSSSASTMILSTFNMIYLLSIYYYFIN